VPLEGGASGRRVATQAGPNDMRSTPMASSAGRKQLMQIWLVSSWYRGRAENGGSSLEGRIVGLYFHGTRTLEYSCSQKGTQNLYLQGSRRSPCCTITR
jgi:hypothetical protein